MVQISMGSVPSNGEMISLPVLYDILLMAAFMC